MPQVKTQGSSTLQNQLGLNKKGVQGHKNTILSTVTKIILKPIHPPGIGFFSAGIYKHIKKV